MPEVFVREVSRAGAGPLQMRRISKVASGNGPSIFVGQSLFRLELDDTSPIELEGVFLPPQLAALAGVASAGSSLELIVTVRRFDSQFELSKQSLEKGLLVCNKEMTLAAVTMTLAQFMSVIGNKYFRRLLFEKTGQCQHQNRKHIAICSFEDGCHWMMVHLDQPVLAPAGKPDEKVTVVTDLGLVRDGVCIGYACGFITAAVTG